MADISGTRDNSGAVQELRWKKFPVLDDGFVCLVDVMGCDASVVQAARVSYGQDDRDWQEARKELPDSINPRDILDVDEFCRATIIKKMRDLIRYMMSGGYEMKCPHGTPFEMAEVKLLVRCPMDVWRQWIRHRTANVNEYSTRYSEAIDSQQKTPEDQWRLQSQVNKQGSGGFATDDVGSSLTAGEQILHASAREEYERRLRLGVAREQARKDLPLSTYTEAYWKCDLRNILHFLGLRMDSHAQLEIRQYATIIGEQIIAPLFPLCWEAFQDYELQSLNLSRVEVEIVSLLVKQHVNQSFGRELDEILRDTFPNSRERAACLTKLTKLGLM